MKTSDNHGRVPLMFAASQRRYCAGGLSAGLATSAPRLPVRLLFSALFAAALAQPTNHPITNVANRNAMITHTLTRT